jgi:uncharacterized Zn finger protein (UPF0148 family)
MILTVQFVNEVRKGEGIMFCPYCSRILFYQEESEGELEMEEAAEEVAEEAEEAEDEEEAEESDEVED